MDTDWIFLYPSWARVRDQLILLSIPASPLLLITIFIYNFVLLGVWRENGLLPAWLFVTLFTSTAVSSIADWYLAFYFYTCSTRASRWDVSAPRMHGLACVSRC